MADTPGQPDTPTPQPPAPTKIKIGARLGRFKVTGKLGHGGMGTVVAAEDIALKRPVALKILRYRAGEGDDDPKRAIRAEQFIREARAAARLVHPHIVQVFEVGASSGLVFIAMEVLEGGTLEERVKADGPFAIADALRWIDHAASGLRHAHDRGVLHRDIKPANLMLASEDYCKITDFGLAHAESPDDPFELPWKVIGTPDYMAPEVLRGESSVQSDVFALGATLWYLLTGQPPFELKSIKDVRRIHTEIPLPNLRFVREDVPIGVAAAIERALALDPAERFQSVGEFAEALRTHAQLSPAPSDPVPMEPVPEPTSPLVKLGLAAVVLGLFVGVVLTIVQLMPENGPVAPAQPPAATNPAAVATTDPPDPPDPPAQGTPGTGVVTDPAIDPAPDPLPDLPVDPPSIPHPPVDRYVATELFRAGSRNELDVLVRFAQRGGQRPVMVSGFLNIDDRTEADRAVRFALRDAQSQDSDHAIFVDVPREMLDRFLREYDTQGDLPLGASVDPGHVVVTGPVSYDQAGGRPVLHYDQSSHLHKLRRWMVPGPYPVAQTAFVVDAWIGQYDYEFYGTVASLKRTDHETTLHLKTSDDGPDAIIAIDNNDLVAAERQAGTLDEPGVVGKTLAFKAPIKYFPAGNAVHPEPFVLFAYQPSPFNSIRRFDAPGQIALVDPNARPEPAPATEAYQAVAVLRIGDDHEELTRIAKNNGDVPYMLGGFVNIRDRSVVGDIVRFTLRDPGKEDENTTVLLEVPLEHLERFMREHDRAAQGADMQPVPGHVAVTGLLSWDAASQQPLLRYDAGSRIRTICRMIRRGPVSIDRFDVLVDAAISGGSQEFYGKIISAQSDNAGGRIVLKTSEAGATVHLKVPGVELGNVQRAVGDLNNATLVGRIALVKSPIAFHPDQNRVVFEYDARSSIRLTGRSVTLPPSPSTSSPPSHTTTTTTTTTVDRTPTQVETKLKDEISNAIRRISQLRLAQAREQAEVDVEKRRTGERGSIFGSTPRPPRGVFSTEDHAEELADLATQGRFSRYVVYGRLLNSSVPAEGPAALALRTQRPLTELLVGIHKLDRAAFDATIDARALRRMRDKTFVLETGLLEWDARKRRLTISFDQLSRLRVLDPPKSPVLIAGTQRLLDAVIAKAQVTACGLVSYASTRDGRLTIRFETASGDTAVHAYVSGEAEAKLAQTFGSAVYARVRERLIVVQGVPTFDADQSAVTFNISSADAIHPIAGIDAKLLPPAAAPTVAVDDADALKAAEAVPDVLRAYVGAVTRPPLKRPGGELLIVISGASTVLLVQVDSAAAPGVEAKFGASAVQLDGKKVRAIGKLVRDADRPLTVVVKDSDDIDLVDQPEQP